MAQVLSEDEPLEPDDAPLEPGQAVTLRPYHFRPDAIGYYTGNRVTVIEHRGAEVQVRLPNGMAAVLSRKEVHP